MFTMEPISRRIKTFQRRLLVSIPGLPSPAPRQVDIELSNRCNLHCRMCWFHGESGVGDRYQGRELGTSEILGLIDHLAEYNPSLQIYLGGGEPFVRDDLHDILRHIKSRNLSVAFTSNGTLLTPEKIAALVEVGVDYISVSLDGNEELHDRQRGRGLFKTVTENLKQLCRAREEQGCAKPVVAVNLTLTASLAGRVRESLQAIREATEDGPDFYRMHHLWYVSPAELQAHQTAVSVALECPSVGAASHLAGSIPDPVLLAEELESLRSDAKVRMFPDLGHSEMLSYYSEFPRTDKRCHASLFGAVIKPNGDAMFCPDGWIDGYLLGNVREESFREIWNSAKARRFRSVMIRQKRFQGCHRCSWMYCFQP